MAPSGCLFSNGANEATFRHGVPTLGTYGPPPNLEYATTVGLVVVKRNLWRRYGLGPGDIHTQPL